MVAMGNKGLMGEQEHIQATTSRSEALRVCGWLINDHKNHWLFNGKNIVLFWPSLKHNISIISIIKAWPNEHDNYVVFVQGQSSYGTMGGGGHHPAGSNNYYGNHTGGEKNCGDVDE